MTQIEVSPGASQTPDSSPDSMLPPADDLNLKNSVESENVSLSPFTANKATQKSFKRPERRSRGKK